MNKGLESMDTVLLRVAIAAKCGVAFSRRNLHRNELAGKHSQVGEKVLLAVILSEAKNLSQLKTKGEERFFAPLRMTTFRFFPQTVRTYAS
jgi:hypothetical protein